MADVNSDEVSPRAEGGSVHTLLDQDRTRIVLSGEIDVSVNTELVEAITEAEAAGVPTEVDARQVTFIDSSGVALLARLASRTPNTLTVLDPPEVLTFLLDITRIGELVQVQHTAPSGPGPDDEPPDVVA